MPLLCIPGVHSRQPRLRRLLNRGPLDLSHTFGRTGTGVASFCADSRRVAFVAAPIDLAVKWGFNVRTFGCRFGTRSNGKMFTRLFKPRWEHPDPGIRRQALESGEAPADVLARAAREDPDPDVREAVLEALEALEGGDGS